MGKNKKNFEPELAFLIEVLGSAVDGRELVIPIEFDWTRVLFWVERHRVTGHVYHVLKGYEIPEFVRGELAGLDRANRFKALKLKAETVKVSNLLQENDVACVSVKGVLLSEQLWGDLGRRYAGDIDLLVNLDDMVEADGLVRSMGYGRSAFQGHEGHKIKRHLYFVHELPFIKDDIRLEFLRSVKSQFYHPEVMESKNHVITTVGNTEVRILTKEMHFVELCIHGAGHLWSRLHWLMDIAKILHDDELDWSEVISLVEKWGVNDWFFASCLIVTSVFDLKLPAEIKCKLDQSMSEREVLRVVKYSLDELTSPEAHPSSTLGKIMFFIHTWPKNAKYWSLGRRLLYHGPDWDLIRLPKPLWWLYYLLCPVFYLLRMMRIIR